MKLSMVILPTSNEAANIGALLERLLHASGLDEVADGGSTDGTPVPVRSSAVRLVHSGAGKTAHPRGPMVSSPRRWEGSAFAHPPGLGFMRAAFALGASPWRLASF